MKIDLSQGLLEVEGSESFVRSIYNDFKSHFIEDEVVEEEKPAKPPKTSRAKTGKSSKRATSRAKSSTKAITPPPAVQAKETAAEPIPELVDVDFTLEEKLPAEAGPSPTKPSYTYIKDLDLGATNGHPSLVEFMDSKFPITNEERNLVFLHYLQNVLGLNEVTADHIYTCYKAANIRTPLNIQNSLEQTANQRHWIKIDESGGLVVTPAGKTYVENQLPKKKKA